MINQHLQAPIAELQEFIDCRPDAREVRKALAVKLVYQGYLYEEIQTILDVSLGSITRWKHAYEQYGIDGLRLNHKGRKRGASQFCKKGIKYTKTTGFIGFNLVGKCKRKSLGVPNLYFGQVYYLLYLLYLTRP